MSQWNQLWRIVTTPTAMFVVPERERGINNADVALVYLEEPGHRIAQYSIRHTRDLIGLDYELIVIEQQVVVIWYDRLDQGERKISKERQVRLPKLQRDPHRAAIGSFDGGYCRSLRHNHSEKMSDGDGTLPGGDVPGDTPIAEIDVCGVLASVACPLRTQEKSHGNCQWVLV